MKRWYFLIPVALLVLLALMAGCDHDTSNGPLDIGGPPPVQTDLTCEGCHTDKDMLIASLGDTAGSKVDLWQKGEG